MTSTIATFILGCIFIHLCFTGLLTFSTDAPDVPNSNDITLVIYHLCLTIVHSLLMLAFSYPRPDDEVGVTIPWDVVV